MTGTHVRTGRVTPGLRRARWATTVVFSLHGAAFASWAARIPAVRDLLGIGTGTLGIVLAMPALGALAGSQAGGKLVDVAGSRRTGAIAPVVLCVALGLIAVERTTVSLSAGLLLLGAADGATAVAMNAQAIAVQQGYGRSVVNGMHAVRSLGAVAGGLCGAGLAALTVPLATQFAGTAAVLAALALPSGRFLLPGITGIARTERLSPGRIRATVVLLALMTFLAALVEDAPASWSGVYLSQLGAAGGIAAAGYAVFSAGEVASRVFADRMVNRFGWPWVIRTGAAAACIMLAVTLLIGNVAVTLGALVVIGIGISVAFPGALAAAGTIPGAAAGMAMGQVNFAGNIGWLVVSPVIGGLASVSSLPAALAVLPVSAAGIALLAPATGRRPRSR